MTLSNRLQYYRRIAIAYLTPLESHLTFWHEPPTINPRARYNALGEYYMPFAQKADYRGPYDEGGIPLLNYRGAISLQYNPIAIAQYGLGNYNLFLSTGDPTRQEKFVRAADWLVSHQERNPAGLSVWNHHFDWDYRSPLKSPWYSALAQGQGISLLVRAHQTTGHNRYISAAANAFDSFRAPLDRGGVTLVDPAGNLWFEEYITSPPTHVLNGFIWAIWGVFDFYLSTSSPEASRLFTMAAGSLASKLQDYDTGFWSLYEQSGTRMEMLASPFYHSLHIVQLRILYRLTGCDTFREFAERWEGYRRNKRYCLRVSIHKSIFKLCYY